MPFSKMPGGVADALQGLRQCYGVEAGDVAIANIIGHNNDDVWLGIQMDGIVFCEAC